jgi:inosose dehydratase
MHLKDAEAQYSTAKDGKGRAPSEEVHQKVNLYKRLGSGGVDFSGVFQELRRRNYDGWVTMDFDMPRPGEGTVEDDMNRHKSFDRNTEGACEADSRACFASRCGARCTQRGQRYGTAK